ncbi:TetR/AcrR family transcriptional regulator [uncultured Parasphingorhabdus sp.]|uniref:TetR/AcrR family transcriptional regulator n=1 Tax=uncultured Parasphingorhabdus sp. TaxID=2709694 RepID=UPI002AA728E7|nr:TetR/AcrR family transcriptional regulator [uncultured Parasphingorhabdus sp.]
MAEVKRRTQAERREQAEARLLDQAVKLVGKLGYDGFTLADVAETAGYSRGLPAHYFGSKEELLARVAEHVIGSYNEGAGNISSYERGLPTLVALVRKYVKGHGVEIRTLQILITQALVIPRLRKTIAKLNAEGKKNIEAEIRIGIEQGNIRPDIDPTAHAAVIYSFLRGQMAFAALNKSFDQNAAGEEFVSCMCARLQPN